MRKAASSESGHVTPGVVPAECVRMTGETARVTASRPGAAGKPVVELIRDGDTVRAIDVTCTCGRRIRLSCLY